MNSETAIVAAAVLLLGLIAACGTTPASATPTTEGSIPAASATPSGTPDPTVAWVSYHSIASHLTFRHPVTWQPVECNGVTAVDNATPVCAPGEGPPATLTIFTDQGELDYTGGWPESPLSVNDIAGKCFTDSPTTQTPAPDNGPVLAYSSYTVCDVNTGSRTYHFTFIVPSTSGPNLSNSATRSQFEQFLETVTFDS